MKKLTLFGFLFCTLNVLSQEMTTLKTGEKFPDFELTTIDGESVSSESLKGKVVFINLWFTRCAPCIEEMPSLNDLQEAYKDKVEFISITFDDGDLVKKFLSKTEFKFQHLVNADHFLNEELKNRQYPINLIMDRSGTITYLRGSIPFTKDPATGEMVPVPYSFLKAPIEKALAD